MIHLQAPPEALGGGGGRGGGKVKEVKKRKQRLIDHKISISRCNEVVDQIYLG